jgi:hypothetical protein
MNTDRYQHGSNANDEYITKRLKTSKEEDDLISTGFEYVRFDDREQVPIYREGSKHEKIYSFRYFCSLSKWK